MRAKGGPAGNAGRPADNGIVGIGTERREEGVHRAAHAPIETGIAHENLGQNTGQKNPLAGAATRIADILGDRAGKSATIMRAGDRGKIILRHRGYRGQPHGAAHSSGLLPDRQMRRPLIDIILCRDRRRSI